jgi:hypothetical protein
MRKIAIVALAAAMLASPAEANWWAFGGPTNCEELPPTISPARIYEIFKELDAQIEDRGHGVVVVSNVPDNFPHVFFRAEADCRVLWDWAGKGIAAKKAKEKEELDPYR